MSKQQGCNRTTRLQRNKHCLVCWLRKQKYEQNATAKPSKLTDEDVKKHPVFLDYEKKWKQEKETAVLTERQQFEQFKTQIERGNKINLVKSKANEFFNILKPILPKDITKAENYRKMLLSMVKDVRVILVKFADRLHNMSTLDAVRPEKQRTTAQETLDFYVPFARLMGLNDIADYIEVLCYRNLDSDMYNKISDKLLQHGLGRNFQREAIHRYLSIVLNNLGLNGLVKVLDNRVVIYRQFFRNRGEINALLRHYAFEIVLDNIEACDKLAYYLIKKYYSVH